MCVCGCVCVSYSDRITLSQRDPGTLLIPRSSRMISGKDRRQPHVRLIIDIPIGADVARCLSHANIAEGKCLLKVTRKNEIPRMNSKWSNVCWIWLPSCCRVLCEYSSSFLREISSVERRPDTVGSVQEFLLHKLFWERQSFLGVGGGEGSAKERGRCRTF